MKVANMRWVYIVRVTTSSTASYHKVHRTDVDPVSHSVELFRSRTYMQLEHQCPWMTPRSWLELRCLSSPLCGVMYMLGLLRVLSEHSGVEPTCSVLPVSLATNQEFRAGYLAQYQSRQVLC